MGNSDNRGPHVPASELPWYRQLTVSDQAAYANLALAVLAIVLALGVFAYQIYSDVETTRTLNASRDALNRVVIQLGMDEQSLKTVSSGLTSANGSLQQLQHHAKGELDTLRAADTALAKFVSSAQSQYEVARKNLSVSQQQDARAAFAARAQYNIATKTLAVLRLQFDLADFQYKRALRAEQAQPNVHFTIAYVGGGRETPIPWHAAPKPFVVPGRAEPELTFSIGEQNLGDGSLASSSLKIAELDRDFELSSRHPSPCRRIDKNVLQCDFGAQIAGPMYTTRFALSSSSATPGPLTVRLRITLTGTTASGRKYKTAALMTFLVKEAR